VNPVYVQFAYDHDGFAWKRYINTDDFMEAAATGTAAMEADSTLVQVITFEAYNEEVCE
jgi:hypothetical protein